MRAGRVLSGGHQPGDAVDEGEDPTVGLFNHYVGVAGLGTVSWLRRRPWKSLMSSSVLRARMPVGNVAAEALSSWSRFDMPPCAMELVSLRRPKTRQA